MRSGKLDRVIDIQWRTTGLDLYGTPIDVWKPFAAFVRAQKIENATSDREAPRGGTTDTLITFRIRFLADVSLDHRVVYEGQAFTITRISEIGRRVGLDITCERLGANNACDPAKIRQLP
jgi:SPP1 family predicted phage head-tail adaptor